MKWQKHKKKLAVTATATTIAVMEIITGGTVDWYTVEQETNPEVIKAAESSLYLALPGARCSGSVIAPELIISNSHCLGTGVGKFKVTADYKDSIPKHKMKWFQCETIVANNDRLDYSVAKCPGMDLVPLTISVDPIKKDDDIYLIHQNCDYKSNSFCKTNKVISYGKINSATTTKLRHNADSLGGSSGAPIFNNAAEIIGIHNSGYGDVSGDGRGIENGGILIKKIIESMPSEIRGELTLIGDIDSIQPTYQVGSTTYKPGSVKYVSKKSFKCRYFSWLFRRKCR